MIKKSDFANRLLRILEQKNISARSLSISLGYMEHHIQQWKTFFTFVII